MKQKRLFMNLFVLFAVVMFLFVRSLDMVRAQNQSGAVENNDWPQWRGPNRDGISKETGLLKSWPTDGPKVLWKKAIGDGFSAISVVKDWLFTAYTVDDDEFLFCLTASDGKEVGHPKQKNYGNAEQGADRGYSSSPLIEGELLITNVGRQPGKTIVAFNKRTGKLVWTSQTNEFSSSIFHQGHIYGFDNAVLKCLDAGTGEEKWKAGGLGQGSLILADQNLIVLSDKGKLALIEATPSACKEKAGAQILSGKCWTMPVLAGGRLYLRNQTEMVCLDIAESP
jgi:outer membrane protein assembly factor BamB